MPQWAGSCWYYLRFLDPKNDREPWNADAERQWMPVDIYIGGAEHAVLHLLYARFWHKVLFDAGYVSTPEPFAKLRHQGTVLAYAYRDSADRWHGYEDVEFRGGEAFSKSTGEKLQASVEKMSKSRGNVINPDDVVAEHGADVLRLYEMFMGDFEQQKPWDTRAIVGLVRFVHNVWRIVEEPKRVLGDPNRQLRHKTIRAVGERIEALKFNTAISALMEYVGELQSKGASPEDQETLVRLVAPFAPHVAEEALGASWPRYAPLQGALARVRRRRSPSTPRLRSRSRSRARCGVRSKCLAAPTRLPYVPPPRPSRRGPRSRWEGRREDHFRTRPPAQSGGSLSAVVRDRS